MKVLNFYNVKGGVGKSSLAFLAGKYLSEAGNRILFADLDPQCSLTSVFTEEPADKTIYDFLSDSEPLESIIVRYSENVSYIPSSLKVFKIQDRVLQNKLERAFRKLKGYDFIIIDNSPNYSALSVSSVQASDFLFCPSQVSRFDFDSLVFTIGQALEVKEEIKIRVIMNRVSKTESREEKIMKESLFLSSFQYARFQNQNSIRKVSASESLDKQKFSKLKESIKEVMEGI